MSAVADELGASTPKLSRRASYPRMVGGPSFTGWSEQIGSLSVPSEPAYCGVATGIALKGSAHRGGAHRGGADMDDRLRLAWIQGQCASVRVNALHVHILAQLRPSAVCALSQRGSLNSRRARGRVLGRVTLHTSNMGL